MELDLFDFLLGGFGVGGTFFGEFGGAVADAGVGRIDVVLEDFLGVVAWSCYAVSAVSLSRHRDIFWQGYEHTA